MAFVEQITALISTSWFGNEMNSSQTLFHSLMSAASSIAAGHIAA
jgi:hypothetical protein